MEPHSPSPARAHASLLPLLASGLLLATLLGPTPARAEDPPTPLEQNQQITQGYIQLAYALHSILDPNLQPGGVSSVRPNWFCFAPHASQTGGEGLLAAAMALHMLETARGEPSLSVAHALDRVGLTGSARISVEQLAVELVVYGLPFDAAASLASLTTAMNGEALADPRTLAATSSRFASLYWSASTPLPLDKAEVVIRTFERTVNEGNVAIFTDIGGSALLYLDWRAQVVGAVTPERVLNEFTLVDAVPSEAWLAYDYAVLHAEDTPRPYQLHTLLPGMHWKSLLVAAFALYEEARLAPTPARRDALIAMGNNYVAWREQHDMAQPVFSPATQRPDEVSRAALLQALTPMLTTDFGTVVWNYSDFAYSQPDPDGNPLTSPPTEYSWAVFWDRWTGILYAFEQGYADPTGLWEMPGPLVDPTSGP